MSFASFHNPIVARTYREGVHGWFAVASVLTAVTIALGCGGDTDLSACILPPPTDRLEVRQLTYVKASVGAGTESAFGAGVSLSADGSTLAVGAPYDPSGALGVNADPTDRSRTDAGAAHVFVRSGVTWVQEAYLKPANAHAAVEFGRLVSLSKTGDTLIVGVPQDSDPKFSGSAVVFRRVGGRWTEEGYLRSSLGGSGGQFGVSVGQIDFDHTSSDTSGGFTMTGGYRALPWLSAEANFTYLGGGEGGIHGGSKGDSQFFAFTFGPKVYPLGFFKVEEIPDFIQPYALVGLGGGQFDIEGRSGMHDESSFIARFMLGFDVWATDHVGFFVEGGGHAASQDDVQGVGLFTVGGQYRF